MPKFILTLASHKGGTGKTTMAVNLAAHMARFYADLRGLFVDIDSQANATTYLGDPSAPYTSDPRTDVVGSRTSKYPKRINGVLDVVRGALPLEQCIVRCDLKPASPTDVAGYSGLCREANNAPGTRGLDLLSAHRALDRWQAESDQSMRKPFMLMETLRTSNYDWVVIDTPPALGYSLTNALFAGTHLVIVAQPGIGMLHGIDSITDVVMELAPTRRRLGMPDLAIIGVLGNRWSMESAATRAMVEIKHTEFALLGPMPDRSALKNAAALQQDIYAHSKAHTDGSVSSVAAMFLVAQSILERVAGISDSDEARNAQKK